MSEAVIDDLKAAKKILGFAALGAMLSPDSVSKVARIAEHAKSSCTAEEAKASVLQRCASVMSRGLLPSATFCREAQREVHTLMERLRESSAPRVEYSRPH